MNQKFIKSIKNIIYIMFDTYFRKYNKNNLFFEYGGASLNVELVSDTKTSFGNYFLRFKYNNYIVELTKKNNMVILKNGYISDLNDIFYFLLVLYRNNNDIVKQLFDTLNIEYDNNNNIEFIDNWKKYLMENLSNICDNYNICQNINICWQCIRVLPTFNLWIRENFLEKFLDEYGSIFVDVLLHNIPKIKKECDNEKIPEILYLNIIQFTNGNTSFNIEIQFYDYNLKYVKEFYENIPEKFIMEIQEIEDIKEKFVYIQKNLRDYKKVDKKIFDEK